MYKIRISLVVILSTMLFSSCATLIGSKYPIYIQSFPSGASVTRDGKELGTTPLYLDVKAKSKNHPFEISKTNYETSLLAPNRQFRFLLFVDLILNPPIIAIDFLTNSAKKYKSSYYEANLVNKETKQEQPSNYNSIEHFYIKNTEGKYFFCQPGFLFVKGAIKYKAPTSSEWKYLPYEKMHSCKALYTFEPEKKLRTYFDDLINQGKVAKYGKKEIFTSQIHIAKPNNPKKSNFRYCTDFNLIFEKNNIKLLYNLTITVSGGGGKYGGPQTVSKDFDIRIYDGDKFVMNVKNKDLEEVIMKYYGDSKLLQELQAQKSLKREWLPQIAVLYRYLGNQ